MVFRRAKRKTVFTTSEIRNEVLPKRKPLQAHKLTQPHEFTFNTLKRALVRGQKKIVAATTHQEKKRAKSSWKATLTEPKEFHFRTEERNLARQGIHPVVPEPKNSKSVTRVKSCAHLKLTEPQSPFFHTKQRSQLKRHRSTVLPPLDDEPVAVDILSSTFDREYNEPPKKRYRNSITEPKPFHFQTKDRAGTRTRVSIDTTASIPKSTSNWTGTLTEPQSPFFHTKQRATERNSFAKSVVNPISVFNSEDLHVNVPKKRKRTQSIVEPRTLTEPKPFFFQTEQRSLQKIEQNRLHTRSDTTIKPAVKRTRRVTVVRAGENTDSSSIESTNHTKSLQSVKPKMRKRPTISSYHNNRAL